MNLLLLRDDDFVSPDVARITGRRLVHAREVLRAARGDRLRVGRLGGNVGTGEVLSDDRDELVLRVALTEPPPPRPGVDLLLAIPRPKALKRVLSGVASLGIDRVVLVNAARVEKSYFESHVLASADEYLALGLEQARDTRPPEVLVRERFRPFVEDELDSLFAADRVRLVAHPSAERRLEAVDPAERVLLAIGPEGGWVPFELDLLEAHRFIRASAGPRSLRVEVAVPYFVGALRR